jgi:peptidoglycan/xylan/chitin deacetylase (PgdA/CDA1 family)
MRNIFAPLAVPTGFGLSRLHLIGAVALVASVMSVSSQTPATTITKWQDGRQAAVALTFDDSTINQFRVALPLMNERGLPGTFFVITGQIPGSRYKPTFVGRPIMEILRESEAVPTNKSNGLERASMLRYLAVVERDETVLASTFRPNSAGAQIAKGDFVAIDATLARLRETGVTYAVGAKSFVPVRSEEAGRPVAAQPGGLTWDEFRREAAKGHEFANHLVSHAHTPGLDEANILYEAEKARDDLREQLGEKHTFSIESAFGIHDERVGRILIPRFPLTRNWVADSDDFMDGIMRGNSRSPAASTREYVQWQRGPVTETPLEEMKGWVETSLANGTWLVLVIHGIEGVGYQPLPAEKVRAYFDYLKALEDRVWVATFQDGAKYMRERMRSTVTTKQAGQAIEVTVTHSLDPKMYDLPLTARTTVPADWTSAQVRQGNQTRTVPVQRERGAAYVHYRVAPNGGVVQLQRGRQWER